MEFNIDHPIQRFTHHLSVPFNDRIIFSGPFGTGKTYFLEKYFKNKPFYNVIHLYPVNYSVASNEDIFELIKYDILFELLGKNVDFENIEISHLEFFKQFAFKNAHHILAPFLNFLPEIGKSVHTVYEKLQALGEKYFVEYEGANTDDKKAVIDYLGSFTKTKGSIFEEDFYTQLICQLVEQLKIEIEQSKKCETVLIIDDLDRIDPEHIFRILNVLSAHMDVKGESGNKFNFDKIILVFDQQNVHKIFQNRYGSDVDFSGYIDKFYSYQIFEFENLSSLANSIRNCLLSIQSTDQNKYLDFKTTGTNVSYFVTYVLTALILAKRLTIRRLLKVMEKPFFRKEYTIHFTSNHLSYKNSSLEIVFISEFLLHLYGTWEELLQSLENCKEFTNDEFTVSRRKTMFNFCLVVLDNDSHRFRSDEKNLTYNHFGTNQAFHYSAAEWHHQEFDSFICRVTSIKTIDNDTIQVTSPKFIPILIDTINYMRDNRMIQQP